MLKQFLVREKDTFINLDNFIKNYEPPTQAPIPLPVSKELYGRLSKQDITRVVKLFDKEDKQLWETLKDNSGARQQIFLNLAAHYKDEAVLKKTGLISKMPPEDIHSMARGKLAAGGSTYYADMVIGTLETSGLALPSKAKILDFGSSSGRVLRVLRAYRSDWLLHGCDVNKRAIKWASNNLPGMSFDISPLRPPLNYKSNMFNLIFAISMWSHFNAITGEAWLNEVHRILKPGGMLFLTTHGLQSVYYYKKRDLRSDQVLSDILNGLYSEGFHFINMFGAGGDWGIIDSDWGDAFMSMAWLANHLSPKWELLNYFSGVVEGNQDVVLLRAR